MNTIPHDSELNMLSIEALFDLACTSTDEDVVWAAIERLRSINSDDVFLHAQSHCASQDARERQIGVHVIAQLGIPQPTYHEPVVQLLLHMLSTEHEPEVLDAIGTALGHRGDERAIGPLLAFREHPDHRVRHGVAFGLLGHTDPGAIDALIELSDDPNALVRNWANFGLAIQIDSDTPAIRAALVARLNDSERDTREEAMLGLARRNDDRVIAPLLEALEMGQIGRLPLDAAAALADPCLLPALQQLKRSWTGEPHWKYGLLEEAITACSSEGCV